MNILFKLLLNIGSCFFYSQVSNLFPSCRAMPEWVFIKTTMITFPKYFFSLSLFNKNPSKKPTTFSSRSRNNSETRFLLEAETTPSPHTEKTQTPTPVFFSIFFLNLTSLSYQYHNIDTITTKWIQVIPSLPWILSVVIVILCIFKWTSCYIKMNRHYTS